MVFALCLRMETEHLPRRSAQGAALIEVALVLVCTSLLFVSAVKGSELIHNAQSKRVAREIEEHRLAFMAYLNRYDAMPGDDPRASMRWPGAKNGNGDQQISGIYSDAPPTSASALYVSAGTGENLNYWWHLRAAGLLQDGALNLASTADSAVGCTVTVQQSANGMRGPALCYYPISGRLAAAIDRERDDGFANTGSIRASTDPNTTPTSSYDEAENYILCASLGGRGAGLASALLPPVAASPVAGSPSAAGENPNAHGGNPNAHGGNPNAAGGNPNAHGGNPNAAGGNPNANGGNPNASDSQS
jgi:hypothetical protein